MADLNKFNREQLLERKQLLEKKLQLEQELQNAQLSTKVTSEQYLAPMERLKGGFMRLEDLETTREQQRTERGLVPGTPLEPTGFTWENLKDLPNDVLDMLGPAFPAIGQIGGGILGGLATTPTVAGIPSGVIGGGIAGAGLGETARQAIGEYLFGLEQGTLGERAGRIGLETALGALGEGVAVGLNGAIRFTKTGILKAANKLLEKRSVDTFVTAFGRISKNMDGEKIRFALQQLRQGDDSVLKQVFAQSNYADDFVKEVFFGKDNNLAKNIFKLSHRQGAKEPLKRFFNEFLGVSDETFELAVKYGSTLKNKISSENILNLSSRITLQLDDLFNKLGKDLGKARFNLAKQAGNIDVTNVLAGINKTLADDLTNVGFLLKEGEELYRINSSFKITTTGKAQTSLFKGLIDTFFGKASEMGGTYQISDVATLQTLANIGKTKDLYRINPKINFKKFITKLKSFDVQVSGNEFKSLGKLSPQLKNFLEGIRGITDEVAKKVGNQEVLTLNNAYRELAENVAPLRQARKLKNVAQIEKLLTKFANPKISPITNETGEALNTFLKKNIGVNFLDELRIFGAAQEVKELENIFGSTSQRQALVNFMKNAFSEGNRVKLNELEKFVDPILPNNLKIGYHAKTHTTSEALYKDAVSLLRARFLGSALPLGIIAGGTIGGLSGGRAGAITGATTGLIGGFALQNPRILASLLRVASKHGGKKLAFPTPSIAREPIVGGVQLLRKLIQE